MSDDFLTHEVQGELIQPFSEQEIIKLIRGRMEDFWKARRIIRNAQFMEDDAVRKIVFMMSENPAKMRVAKLAFKHALQISALSDREYQQYQQAKRILILALGITPTKDLFGGQDEWE